jgi:hypothetical protein
MLEIINKVECTVQYRMERKEGLHMMSNGKR